MNRHVTSWIHANVWQRLPHDFRRALLFRATALAAPRPTPDAKAALPIIVVGSLTTATGLGQSARLCHDALKAAGLPVFGIDLAAEFMQPQDFSDFDFDDGRDVKGGGTLIIHVNAPTMPLAMLRLGTTSVRDKHVVGCWAWELPQVPADWRLGAVHVHQIWAPSTFAADAIRSIADAGRISVLPYSVAMGRGEHHAAVRPADRPFTALTIFNTASSFCRKNPVAAIAAFRQAFADDPDTRLIVKVSNLDCFPPARGQLTAAIGGAANITLVDRTMSHADIDALYADADCVISLHRSEGFGLILAEAMLRGIPTIATDWSGNVDFFDAAVGMPIAASLIPAVDPQGVYDHPSMRWADPDVTAAAMAFRRLRADPGLCARLGAAARDRARQLWTAERYVAAVRAHLDL